MTGIISFLPGLGGVTSSRIVVVRAISPKVLVWSPASSSSPSDAIVLDRARTALMGGHRDRLAELREAAAKRSRDMPSYEDSTEEAADRADLVETLRQLQAETSAWNAED